MWKIAWLAVVVLLFAFGCGLIPKPTPEQLASADYGSFPADYKQMTTEYISRMLLDPYSAVFSDWKGPIKAWEGNSMAATFGYRVCVSVNAKNRMGGFAGRKIHSVMINNDQIVAYYGGDYQSGTVGEQQAYERCGY